MSKENYVTYGIGENAIEISRTQDELYSQQEAKLISELKDSKLTKSNFVVPKGWKVGGSRADRIEDLM